MFFFSSRRRHTRYWRDWSSDVCSSDLAQQPGWMQVLLPSRPNGSAGWVTDDGLDRAITPYLIRVHLRSLNMELFWGDRRSEERRVGKSVDLGGRRIIKKKKSI